MADWLNLFAPSNNDHAARNSRRNSSALSRSGRLHLIDADTLHTAQARLKQLPTAALPEPAPLPPASRMPYDLPDTPLPAHRAVLLRLAELLKTQSGATTRVVALTGVAGSGKLHVASEFVHRYGQFFSGGVFWLNLAQAASAAAQVALCGTRAHLALHPAFESLPSSEQVRMVLNAWNNPLPRLLVLAGCEDAATLERWRPVVGGCRVLLISQRTDWSALPELASLPLEPLPSSDSTALLQHFRPDLPPDLPDLAALAAALDGLPLALRLASGALHVRPMLRPADYLAQLRARDEADAVARALALALDMLTDAQPVDELARALLARAACFAPGEPLPAGLLRAALPDENTPLADEALTLLLDLGLLATASPATLRLHPRLAPLLRAALPQEALQAASRGVEVAVLALLTQLNQSGDQATLQRLQPHLHAVVHRAGGRGDEQIAHLLQQYGTHCKLTGDQATARACFERALAIREQLLGTAHPDLVPALIHLALLVRDQDDLPAARQIFERALTIREQALGPWHTEVATLLTYLAGVLESAGDYAAAQRHYERALTIREQVLGVWHPRTATSLANLARLLELRGDDAAAHPLRMRALSISEQSLGLRPPQVVVRLTSQAFRLQEEKAGYAQARLLLERALDITERSLGSTHAHTATCLTNLGRLLEAQGDYAAARPLLERALAISERVYGAEHPLVATDLTNLGRLLESQGAYAAARPLLERALSIRTTVLGEQHASVAASLHQLAGLLAAQGEHAAAQDLAARAAAIYS